MAEGDDVKLVKLEDLTNGQSMKNTAVTRRRRAPRRSWKRWLLNNLTRLTVWYSIFTVLFRCPSNAASLDANSPRVCKHYFTAKTYAIPYVQPYYDAYASQYVAKAQPYLQTANERLIAPATVLAVNNYNKYAAPQVARASGYVRAQWEKNALPQLKRAQESAQQAYEENLAPQVLKVSEVASPLYETAKENALTAHEKHIIPAIASSQPHFRKAYNTALKFTSEKGIPFAQHTWSNIVIFTDGTLWPFVKKVYGDNVRPQLVMIGERIVKYQEGRKLHSAMSEVDKSAESTLSVQESTASTDTISSSTSGTTTTSSSTETRSSASVSASEPPRIATDQTISDDLVKWQKKFAIAADKGTDDLKERIEDIITQLVKDDLGEGKGLANALEKTCGVQLDTMKAKINSVVSMLPEDSQSKVVTAAESEIIQAIQEAGSEIKTRAQAVRSWHDVYRQELQQRTQLATDSTLHVLDDIRDLGLQEIGMRWAWMEGVTYKHWQKYHELKKRFADWRSEVRDAALSHPVLSNALEEADTVWEESMAVTEKAAKELIRLKDVARWKIAARDSSDDFDSRAVPAVAAAASAASSIASGIKEALVGSTQGTVESLSSVASDQVAEASSSASSLLEAKQDTAKSLSSDASSAVDSSGTGTVESLVEQASSTGSSLLSSASSVVGDVVSSGSSAVQGSSTGSVESLASSVSSVAKSAAQSGSDEMVSQLNSASDSASSISLSATTGPSEGIASSISSLADSLSIPAASEVDASKASQSLASLVDEAGDKVHEVTSSWATK